MTKQPTNKNYKPWTFRCGECNTIGWYKLSNIPESELKKLNPRKRLFGFMSGRYICQKCFDKGIYK